MDLTASRPHLCTKAISARLTPLGLTLTRSWLILARDDTRRTRPQTAFRLGSGTRGTVLTKLDRYDQIHEFSSHSA